MLYLSIIKNRKFELTRVLPCVDKLTLVISETGGWLSSPSTILTFSTPRFICNSTCFVFVKLSLNSNSTNICPCLCGTNVPIYECRLWYKSNFKFLISYIFFSFFDFSHQDQLVITSGLTIKILTVNTSCVWSEICD